MHLIREKDASVCSVTNPRTPHWPHYYTEIQILKDFLALKQVLLIQVQEIESTLKQVA